MKNNFWKYIILILLVYSCSTKESKDTFVDYFNEAETVNLFSKSLTFNFEGQNKYFARLGRIKYIDSLIILMDFTQEYNLKIVDLRTGLARPFAKKGRGPNEMKSPGCLFSIDYESNNLYVTDNLNYYIYNLDNLKNKIDTPLSHFKTRRFENSTYGYGDYIFSKSEKKKYIKYNISDRTEQGKYDYKNKEHYLAHQGVLINNPRDYKVAFVENTNAVLNIISYTKEDFDYKEYVWRKVPDKEIVIDDSFTTKMDKGLLNSFLDATASIKYIYALYSGREFKRINRNSEYQSKYIYVFDWEGNPIRIYELDQEVESIAIDESDRTLFATFQKNGQPNLITFKLK